MENEDKALKSQMALRRCAKAALLLSELKSFSSLLQHDNTVHYRDEIWRRELEDLKIELVKERLKNKKIKLCALVELTVQILLLLSVWTFFLVFFLKAR